MQQTVPLAWPPQLRPQAAAEPARASALLLADSEAPERGPKPMLNGLTDRETALVMERARRRVLYRGATLFTQETPHDGIWLIETGRIRVFYAAPTGREITLAYWYPGNFVGGPEVFGAGQHCWSGMAASNSSVLHLPGRTLKELVTQIPTLAVNVIEGVAFKGKCYSALAQMLGTRSITERLSHLLLHLADLYGVEEEDGGVAIAAAFTHADLAHMVGATRQWITISLKRMSAQGVLEVRRSQIVLRKPDVLAQMKSGGDA
ncbi:Crp/Fnr family transcriptional regulator [Methylopila sp. 73B]|uniref:Crp/Fnr family transcriptional regulator n=1 Tax=Methylopila sp. 73B TaxID=1120792 RepID=UPI00037C56CA|nr:Crp/Fnr family transcriptional regulator [Methylopila sp. 73B]